MNSDKRTARLAGLLWLLSAVTGGFGLAYIRSNLIIPGDAAATVINIFASEFLFRSAIVGILFGQLFMFFLVVTLFSLFRDVNRRHATVLLASGMMSVGLAVINTLNHFGVLLFLSRPDFLKVFTHEQLDALALVLLRLANGSGQGLIEIFWVPFYFTFGLLIIRSRYLPTVLGVLLMTMGVGFAINILDKFLSPQFHPLAFTRLAMTLGALGGIPTILWLLVMGARTQPEVSEVL